MFEKANEIKALLEQKEKALQGCIRTILTRYVHGVLIVDESRTILFANPAAEGIFDSGEKGLQGRPFEYPIASGVTKELNVRSREGKTVAVEMWMVEIEWDGKPAFFISLHDITERKLAEEALAISEIRYRRLFETAKDGILILDADTGQITDINPFLVEMLGYTTEELLEKRLWEIGSFKDIAASRAAFSELQQKEYLRYEDLPLETRDGQRIDVEFVSNVYTVDRKKMIQCNIRDITARKRAEKEIEILNATLALRAYELETVNQELEAFSYTVSHDLRTPLTNINGYCQLAQELCSANLDERCRGYLREIYDGTLRMNKLIDTLLNFALLTRSDLHRETIDLSEMARAVAAELKMRETERSVTFTIAEGLTVNGDPKLLRVVLENLLGNAWKYTGKREDAVIEFGVTEVDAKPAYFVRDNGSGFDMVYSDRLFTPFQRLPGTSEYSGHGIGLATVQRIVQRHGGRVWAEGEEGKGATFYFSLA